MLCIIQCCYNDVLAVLPTSYGKTIIFGILPYYVNLLRNSELTAKIVVVVPLTSTVIDKFKHFGRYAIRINDKMFSCYDSADFDTYVDVNNCRNNKDVNNDSDVDMKSFYEGNFYYLFGHSKNFVSANAMKEFVKCAWNNNISHIVKDEAHCVVSWGDNFRPDYRQLEIL